MRIFDRNGRVSREDEVLCTILDAVNRTEAITSIARDVELFVQEYGLIAVHLRGLHRETGLVVIVKVGTGARENFWCRELHRLAPDLTPAVYPAGSRLGDIDVHWIALEAIPYGPLGNSWNGREFELMQVSCHRNTSPFFRRFIPPRGVAIARRPCQVACAPAPCEPGDSAAEFRQLISGTEHSTPGFASISMRI